MLDKANEIARNRQGAEEFFESAVDSAGPMRPEKRERLEAAGWRVGDAAELLNLTAGEAEFVDIKLALARRLRQVREEHNWTQAELARHVGSSQSRVAKMEAADASVTVDLLVRSLLAAGIDRRDLGRVVASRR